MAEVSIPVDIHNPGEVFACLGFLEAADILCGNAEGGFDWSEEADVKFLLSTSCERNPFEVVLEFLAGVEPKEWKPNGSVDNLPEKSDFSIKISSTFPENPAKPKVSKSNKAFPIRFGGGSYPTVLSHWVDGSSREEFKLYAGNRSAAEIACNMTKGIAQLWEEKHMNLVECPLHERMPMIGRFNFDAQGAWTAINVGYSLNEHEHQVEASPVVEFLAAWGLENARPHKIETDKFETDKFRYAVWGMLLPLILARAALCGGISVVPLKRFRFELEMSGKNKVVTFAKPETQL